MRSGPGSILPLQPMHLPAHPGIKAKRSRRYAIQKTKFAIREFPTLRRERAEALPHGEAVAVACLRQAPTYYMYYRKRRDIQRNPIPAPGPAVSKTFPASPNINSLSGPSLPSTYLAPTAHGLIDRSSSPNITIYIPKTYKPRLNTASATRFRSPPS